MTTNATVLMIDDLFAELDGVIAERDRLRAENADLRKALQQCYDHLGWTPAKVPAYVADDACAALTKAKG